ncbi:DUF2384 domain-containing protein [bacterium]|nr:DUF2384 domain-containing protein [bacterium]
MQKAHAPKREINEIDDRVRELETRQTELDQQISEVRREIRKHAPEGKTDARHAAKSSTRERSLRGRESEISKKFLADLFGNKDWSAVYADIQEGIAKKAFNAATVESFLEQAFLDETTRASFRPYLVSDSSWKRRRKEKTPLSNTEVERMTNVGLVARRAFHIWTEPGRPFAEKFLTSPHPLLDGQSPVNVAVSEGGLQVVLDLIARIEEGAPV